MTWRKSEAGPICNITFAFPFPQTNKPNYSNSLLNLNKRRGRHAPRLAYSHYHARLCFQVILLSSSIIVSIELIDELRVKLEAVIREKLEAQEAAEEFVTLVDSQSGIPLNQSGGRKPAKPQDKEEKEVKGEKKAASSRGKIKADELGKEVQTHALEESNFYFSFLR